jgi:hypothetical protein
MVYGTLEDSSAAIQRARAHAINVQRFSHAHGIHASTGRRPPVVRSEDHHVRFWNDWADEHWDMVALALAFTMALAFAASLAIGYNTLTTRWCERPAESTSLSAAPESLGDARGALITPM